VAGGAYGMLHGAGHADGSLGDRLLAGAGEVIPNALAGAMIAPAATGLGNLGSKLVGWLGRELRSSESDASAGEFTRLPPNDTLLGSATSDPGKHGPYRGSDQTEEPPLLVDSQDPARSTEVSWENPPAPERTAQSVHADEPAAASLPAADSSFELDEPRLTSAVPAVLHPTRGSSYNREFRYNNSAEEFRDDNFDPSALPPVEQKPLPRLRYASTSGMSPYMDALRLNSQLIPDLVEIMQAGKAAGGAEMIDSPLIWSRMRNEYGQSEAGDRAFRRLMGYFAAASPGTNAMQNARIASFLRAAETSGRRYENVQLPNPYGHPLNWLHELLSGNVVGGSWLSTTQPKTSSYLQSLIGNYEPVPIDRHLVRLLSMLSQDARFLKPQYRMQVEPRSLELVKNEDGVWVLSREHVVRECPRVRGKMMRRSCRRMRACGETTRRHGGTESAHVTIGPWSKSSRMRAGSSICRLAWPRRPPGSAAHPALASVSTKDHWR
jgi:hypothetical protein